MRRVSFSIFLNLYAFLCIEWLWFGTRPVSRYVSNSNFSFDDCFNSVSDRERERVRKRKFSVIKYFVMGRGTGKKGILILFYIKYGSVCREFSLSFQTFPILLLLHLFTCKKDIQIWLAHYRGLKLYTACLVYRPFVQKWIKCKFFHYALKHFRPVEFQSDKLNGNDIATQVTCSELALLCFAQIAWTRR